MQELDALDDDAAGTVFRDVITLAFAGFVTIVILLLPFVNPPAQGAAADAPPPGNMMVEVRWPDGYDTDVDLWVQAPGDVPVGHSNKNGVINNLLRDDLGKQADATPLNQEITYARGLPPGEYVVNLHLYRNREQVFPVPATVVVSTKLPDGGMHQILTTEVPLGFVGEEKTVFRFTLDADGNFKPDSVHSRFKPLMAWGKQ